jgi:hypothetical protein
LYEIWIQNTNIAVLGGGSYSKPIHIRPNQKNIEMSLITMTKPVLSAPSSAKLDKVSFVTVDEIEISDEEDGRTFHDTDAAYVLPNE